MLCLLDLSPIGRLIRALLLRQMFVHPHHNSHLKPDTRNLLDQVLVKELKTKSNSIGVREKKCWKIRIVAETES